MNLLEAFRVVSLLNERPNMKSEEGRVGAPILLWMLGVPGSICVLLWLFIFRGK